MPASRRFCALSKFIEKNMGAYPKNLCKVHNFLLGCRATAAFDTGNDVASYATPMQLHFGGERFLRPIFTVPKLDDVSSNEVSFAELAHWMTQSCRSHALTWGLVF
jgi:hypothetical protein